MNSVLKDLDIFKRKPAPGAQPAAPAAPLPPPPQTPIMPKPSPQQMAQMMGGKYEGPNGTAAVTVDPSGKIISVDGGCTPMFGWKDKELIGQQMRVLLREGSEENLRAFLQHDRSNSNQILSLRVVGRRMDGREFAASMTRLAWTADATLKSKSVGSQECWTAVFRELPPTGDLVTAPAPMPVEDHTPRPVSSRMEDVSQFQGSPAALRSANEELQKKLEAMAAEAWKKSEALTKSEKERHEIAEKFRGMQAEFDQNRATLDLEVEARKVLETQLQELIASSADLQRQVAEGRGKGDQAKVSEQLREEHEQLKLRAQRGEAARQEEVARADGYKTALTNLQHAYDELNARVGADKQTTAEAKRKIEELESVVRGTTAEAERANAELDRLTATRGRLESEWRSRIEADFHDQMKATKAAAERAEAAQQQEASRATRLERDLANARQNYEELNAKLTAELQSSAEAKRRAREADSTMRENAAEVERAKSLAQKYTSERARLESEWHEQLSSARAAAERAEAAQKQEASRATRLERELAGMRENYEELESKLSEEQDSLAESKRRVRELENVVRDHAGELDRVKAATQRQTGDRSRLEAEWQEQVEEAKSVADRAEAAYKQESTRVTRLERELGDLRQEYEDLRSKHSVEKAANAKAKRRVKDLEKQLRHAPNDTSIVAAPHEKRGSRSKVQSELYAELAAAKAAAEEEAAQARRRADDLENRLRQSAVELARAKAALESRGNYRNTSPDTEELTRLRAKEAAQAAELNAMERQVRDKASSVAKVTAEVEKERGERRRVEERFAALSGQLQDLHKELKRHLDVEKAGQGRVSELEQKLRDWKDPKAT